MGFFDLIKLSEEEIKSSGNVFNNIDGNYWDPFNAINLSKINEESSCLNAQYNKLKSNPEKIKKQANIAIAIGLVLLIPFIFFSLSNPVLLLFGIFLGLAPFFYVRSYYKNLSIDLIKLEMALKNAWLYSPNKDMVK